MKKNSPGKSAFYNLIFLLFVFLLLFQGQASAQINIETLRKTELEDGFYLDLSTKVGILAGNSNARRLSGSFRPSYIQDPYNIFLVAQGARGDADNNLFENKGFVHLRAGRSITEIIGIEVFSQEEFNDFIALEERTLFGGGLRLSPFPPSGDDKKDSDFTLHLGVGMMWEAERYKGDDDTYLLRSTNYISGKWKIVERLLFSATTYYQVDTDRAADFRIIFDGSFVVDITERFKFTLNINYRYDNEPAKDVENYDLEITNGIAFLY